MTENAERPGWEARWGAHVPGRRLFVAVPLPEPARDAVAELVARVRAESSGEGGGGGRGRNDVRWVRLDGLHLTLRFLGPTAEELLPPVAAAVRRVAATGAPFDVAIAGGGAFPNQDRPRALWLGVESGVSGLRGLATQLDAAVVGLGWPPDERGFRPHLTLARSDGVRTGPAAVRRLVELAADFRAEFRADRIVLFQSLTGGGPARYEPLVEAPLGSA